MNKQILKKPIFWTIASIIFGCVGEAFGFLYYKVESLESQILNSIVGYTHEIFTVFALFCVYKMISLLIKTRKILTVSSVTQILLLLFIAYTINGFNRGKNEFYRSIKGDEQQKLEFLRHIRIELIAYMSSNKLFPDVNLWSDPLFVRDIHREIMLKYFAFNKYLSNATIEQLPSNIVLLVEFEGGINYSGTDELLKQPMKRDKHYLFSWQPFNYILFVDGTIVKYRRSDGAISKYGGDYDKFGYSAYDEAYRSFGPFLKKGTTPYSPLQWEVNSEN
jgi:hypothetical protein